MIQRQTAVAFLFGASFVILPSFLFSSQSCSYCTEVQQSCVSTADPLLPNPAVPPTAKRKQRSVKDDIISVGTASVPEAVMDSSILVIQRRRLCDNAIVDKAKARAAIDLRERWMTSVEFLDRTHAMHNTTRPLKKEKWTFLGPETPVCPVELTTFGRPDNVDQQKVFCLPDSFFKESSEDSCIVFSIGGNNQWDFEIDVHKRTNCRIHTFDCTVKGRVPQNIKDRTTFHELCIDGQDRIDQMNDRKYKTLESLIGITGGKRPTLLKIDVEGFEFPLFRRWLLDVEADPERYLPLMPDQLAFEIHSQYPKYNSRQSRSAAELMVLSQAMYRIGYVVVLKRLNPRNYNAMEVLMQRIIC